MITFSVAVMFRSFSLIIIKNIIYKYVLFVYCLLRVWKVLIMVPTPKRLQLLILLILQFKPTFVTVNT